LHFHQNLITDASLDKEVLIKFGVRIRSPDLDTDSDCSCSVIILINLKVYMPQPCNSYKDRYKTWYSTITVHWTYCVYI